uniref:DUF4371 domain-containing protein n=1 Tax=Octopus bimaculoides TaxID=37653 RepID=A0A0L8HRB5_OCTBM
MFLAKQNVALQGHREDIRVEKANENKRNFLEIVQLIGKLDPVLHEHLVKVKIDKFKTSYLSPKIQNEFVNVLGDQVRKKVIDEVKENKYHCIIFYSTPDFSHIDQIFQVPRYVKIDEKEVKEEFFLRFIEMKGKNAEQITSMILKQLEMDINIQDCRGQAFDNAAVMAARITEVNPNIVFVTYTHHSEFRSCACASVGARFFGTLDRLFSFFSASTHRWDILIEITGATIKRVGETRWSSRADAVKVVHTKFTEIIAALERLMENAENATTRSDAGLILQAMLLFSFL